MEKYRKNISNIEAVGVVLILFLSLFYLTGFKANADTMNINGIPRDPSLDSSNTSYGKFHDRHDLGKTMARGSQLRIKATKPVTLWLLTNDQKTEKSYQINGTEQVITANVNATPFITTPRDNSALNVEYNFSGETLDLPTYQKNEDSKRFINQWDVSKAPFGLIKGKYFQLYLPLETLNKIKNMSNLSGGFKDLTDLENFYDNELFPLYNQLTGLPNNSNRFFLKADTHGAGGAYYGNNWTADSSSSGEMWLKNIWGVKHEIGHGFQNNLMRQMGMGEVSNNILGAYYDYHVKFNREADKKSWLFNYDKQISLDKELSSQLSKGGHFSDLDLRKRLILIYTIFDRIGIEGISDINKAARVPQLGTLFTANSENLYNYLSKIGQKHGLDLNKIMLDYGFSTNTETYFYQNELFSNTSVLDSVNNLVTENDLETVVNQLWQNNGEKTTRTRFNLVTPKELSVTGLKSNVIINIINQLPDSLIGTEASLYDGENKIASTRLDNTSSITFKDVPLGAYRIKFSSSNERVFVNNPYVISSQKGTVSNIKVEKYKNSTLLNYNTFEFKGLGNYEFMSIETTPSNSNSNVMIDINFFSKNPHSYFSNKKYAGVTIDSSGQTLFNKEILGNSTDLFRKLIDLPISSKANSSISIYHEEPSRLMVKNIIGDIISERSKTNKFTFTNFGLVNTNSKIDVIEKIVNKLGDSYLDNKSYLHGDKLVNDFYWLLKSLPEKKQTVYMEKYKGIVGGQGQITGSDFSMYVGDRIPTVSDFKGFATDTTGSESIVTLDLSKVDLTKPGIYDVTLLSADGQTKIVKLTVKENKQSIIADDVTTFVGNTLPEDRDFNASATDKEGNKISVTIDKSKVNMEKPGDYDVVVTALDGQTKTVKVQVNSDEKSKSFVIYRLYNKNSGEHFYTASQFERDSLVNVGWKNEGTGWTAPADGTAVYRVYNPNIIEGDHYYTSSKFEANSLVKKGWKWDNDGKEVFYSGGRTPIYVAYNPNSTSGSHNYTSSSFEQNSLLNKGWKYGKVQFYGR